MICAIDRDAAIAMKTRLRCGWQAVAQAMGVSVVDLRRVCDPQFAFLHATPATAKPAAAKAAPAKPVAKGKTAARRAPVVPPRGCRLETTPGGVEALGLLSAAKALPGGRFVMASTLGGVSSKREAQTVSRRMALLHECKPPLVERRSLAGKVAGWRLTVAGWTALQDAASREAAP